MSETFNTQTDHDFVYSYSTNPASVFGVPKQKTWYGAMGIEIELVTDLTSEVLVQKAIECQTNGSALGSAGIFKNDGSLSEGEYAFETSGFEFATRPLVWTNEAFTTLGDLYTKFGRVMEDDCTGLHVHFSRDHISNNEILKLAAILGDLTDAQDLFLFGRSDEEYCQKQRYNFRKFREGRTYSPDGRYVGLNTENSETIELRVFSGAYTHEILKQYVETAIGLRWLCTLPLTSMTDVWRYANLKSFAHVPGLTRIAEAARLSQVDHSG